MRIKRLELNGFKSFPEKTVIPFPKGISGVVGPNGCGKSNIVDAIKWVMGEQSPRQLRGKGMEDVIFAGSTGKGSVGMAEVSMVLENDNGSLPPELSEFSEVVITRRLFRDGESEYSINNRPCRLKDITHLFLGTGAGSRTYAVIEQGRVGAIIDSKAEDRRHWIEEAAGISKYKHRKQETLRKLEATEQNLLRVNDVIAEVRRQMNSLHRQAKKAERYKENRRELKEIELTLTARDYRDLLEEKKRLEGDQTASRRAVETLRSESLGIEDRLGGIAGSLQALEEELRAVQEAFYRQQAARERGEMLQEQARQEQQQSAGEARQIEKELTEIGTWLETAEGEATVLREELETYNERLNRERAQVTSQEEAVARLKSETHQAQAEVEKKKDRLLTTLNDQTRVRNRLLGLVQLRENRRLRTTRQVEEKNQLNERLAHLGTLSGEIGQEISEKQRIREELKNDLAAARFLKQEQEELFRQTAGELLDLEKGRHEDQVQIKNLRDIQNSFQSFQNGVRVLFQENFFERLHRCGETAQLLAQGIETEPGFETAVEAALGEALQAVLVADSREALEGIRLLKTSGRGKAAFIALNTSLQGDPGHLPVAAVNGFKPLLSKVTAQPELKGWLERLLGSYLLVPSVEEGWALCQSQGGGLSAVTPEGDLINRQGIISGGSAGDGEGGILIQKNRIRSLEDRLREWDEKLALKKEARAVQENAVREIAARITVQTDRLREVEIGLQELEKRLFGYQEEAKPIQRRLEILALEEEETRSQVLEEDSQEEAYRLEETVLDQEIARIKSGIQEDEQQLKFLEEQLEEGREFLTQVQTGFSAMREKGEHLNREWKRLEESLGDRRNREGKLRARLDQISRLQQELAARLADGTARLAELGKELADLEAATLEKNRNREKTLQEKTEVEAELKEKRVRLEEKEALEKELSLQNAQAEMRLEHLKEKAFEQFGLDPQAIFDSPQPEPEALADLEKKRQELREKLDQMGEVNLVAIEEYQAFKERHDFYAAQEEDLQKSMDGLKRAIQKINATSKELFLSTFKAIQENMDRVFPVLFGGGTAKLSLTNEEEPLEASVDILVHPPGKRVTNMTLLSGGEKALTALALIFSIYLVKPSPFCLLDEIDAFLDEANVERFKKFVHGLVQESQIILVTHNRRIMEMADSLYGVTMETPGVSKLVSVRLEHLQN
ncbi:MAG: chromosome segregation protein SMC [Deltaproteobacteria bacterium]|nr:chromosome segregation protein SMC [Deltaproteobacteria bacterium]